MSNTEYCFSDVSAEPCIAYVQYLVENGDIVLGTMVNKNLVDISWNPEGTPGVDSNWLKAWFDPALDASDEAILAAYVGEAVGKVKVRTTREEILGDIFDSTSSPEQTERLLAALDLHASLIASLDNGNYPLGREIIVAAYDAGQITADDRDLCLGIIPDAYFVPAS